MESIRPNEKRAKIAITLIQIVLLLEIVSFISGYLQYNLLETAASGGDISAEAADSNDMREQVIGVFYTIAYIISAITFIQWFRRAYYNLHLKVTHLEHSEGWAAGSWFVPIVSLFRPYQIMKELYVETKTILRENKLIDNNSLTTNYLSIWWGVWILENFLGQFVFRYTMQAETIDQFITSTGVSMASNIIGIPAALITIKVIKDYAKAEPLLNKINNEIDTITID